MKDFFLPEDWPAPNDYLLEMGRIFALWGSLEAGINLAITKLAGNEIRTEWRSAILITHSNFQQRVNMLETLCYELQTVYKNLSKFKSVISNINKVKNDRNKFAHNSMYLNKETGKVETSYVSARGKLKAKIKEVKLEELQQLSADIHKVILDLHHLITQVRYPPIWER